MEETPQEIEVELVSVDGVEYKDLGVELKFVKICIECNEVIFTKPSHQRHLKSKKHIANCSDKAKKKGKIKGKKKWIEKYIEKE